MLLMNKEGMMDDDGRESSSCLLQLGSRYRMNSGWVGDF